VGKARLSALVARRRTPRGKTDPKQWSCSWSDYLENTFTKKYFPRPYLVNNKVNKPSVVGVK